MKSNLIAELYKEWESVLIPVVLLATGLILVGGDSAGIFSLDRIQNLWPFALILVGLGDLLLVGNDAPQSQSLGKKSAPQDRNRV